METKKKFETMVAEIGLSAVPERFRDLVANVAFLIEDEPDNEVRKSEGLGDGETLLGYYRGVPHTERGDLYGVGAILPDTITLYRKPIEEEGGGDPDMIRGVIRETIWHEVAHHFGLEHDDMKRRHGHSG